MAVPLSRKTPSRHTRSVTIAGTTAIAVTSARSSWIARRAKNCSWKSASDGPLAFCGMSRSQRSSMSEVPSYVPLLRRMMFIWRSATEATHVPLLSLRTRGERHRPRA